MNYLIFENTVKNPVNIHSGKEKGKEKIEENKINQEKSEKKLKIIKLNLKQIQINLKKIKSCLKVDPVSLVCRHRTK